MSGNHGVRRRAIVPVLVILAFGALCLVPGVAAAGKADTDVGLRIKPVAGGYEYKVTVSSPKKSCKKYRGVIVWHDENRNGVYDPGEFVIAQDETNKRGRLVFVTDSLPPVGDYIGVLVGKRKGCKSFEDSVEFTGFE